VGFLFEKYILRSNRKPESPLFIRRPERFRLSVSPHLFDLHSSIEDQATGSPKGRQIVENRTPLNRFPGHSQSKSVFRPHSPVAQHLDQDVDRFYALRFEDSMICVVVGLRFSRDRKNANRESQEKRTREAHSRV
jgi:hypothetical protein